METGRYRIPIDGNWSLEDLYIFPKTFEQCYYLYLSFLEDSWDVDADRVEATYSAFPWRGGYSAVNFYNNLKYSVPMSRRPKLRRIEYSSPGLIELILVVAVAKSIERIVRSFCDAGRDLSGFYTDICRGMQERKIMRVKTQKVIDKLSHSDREFVEECLHTMADVLGIDPRKLNKRTGSSYKSLKILLSLYRRIKKLADFQSKGKTWV